MVAESLRDIPTDEELSGDENDPELLVSYLPANHPYLTASCQLCLGMNFPKH
jgi:hypothetical protein